MTVTPTPVRRWWRCMQLAAALGVAVAAPVQAQYVGPAAGVSTAPAAFRAVSRPTVSTPGAVAPAPEGAGRRVLDRMGTGLLIGAGVGLVAAFVHTEITGDYSDHSMDGLAYVAAIPVGALAGLVVGFVVGVTGH